MEQLSFASVYRTAAILAAFSHASAAGEDVAASPAAARWTSAPPEAGATRLPHTSLLEHCRRLAMLRWKLPPARVAPPDARLETGGWKAGVRADAWSIMGPHRPCVTSHFAFADHAERIGPDL